MPLRGKVALVTGGAHRVGRSIVLELAARGAHVAINYHRSEKAALDTERCAAGFGVGAMRVRADAADPAQVSDMIAAVESRLGPIAFLVASAGVFRRTPINAVTERDWDEMMRGNFEVFRVPAAAIAATMQQRGGGAIVAIADVAAVRPWADYIPYCVAKSRVLNHARRLAVALAPAVRVNSVLPGPVLFPPDYPEVERQQEISRTLLRRGGHPEEVARVVAFLLENDYLTGVELPVDGGRLLA
jgi:NAD(P)-dependent dehydrogenase (short-subunit alcohol dehydrogenase family)